MKLSAKEAVGLLDSLDSEKENKVFAFKIHERAEMPFIERRPRPKYRGNRTPTKMQKMQKKCR